MKAMRNWLLAIVVSFTMFVVAVPSIVLAIIPQPARIGGTVLVNGVQLTQATDAGFTFVVTNQSGNAYIDNLGNPAQDTDGLNASNVYIINIPSYDVNDQPGGANPGATAVIHVYKDGNPLAVTTPPGGVFTVGDIGSVTSLNLQAGSAAPPSADFIGTPVSGKAPLLVSFIDSSKGEITSRSWDFGDGTSSTAANPQHTYNVPGTYTVALTVEGPGGEDAKERMNYIVVSSQSSTSLLYFPHIASVGDWETEIGIINDSDTYLNGVLNVYDRSGSVVSGGKPITLVPHERMQFDVSYAFTNHNSIAYAILQTDTDKAKGYVKFFLKGNDRVAIPAVSRINTGVIYIPHIASTVDWWTGIALVNTASSSRDISITFDRGDIIPMTLGPYEHRAFTISQLFNGQEQPTIHSAIIEDAGGVIGLEIYGGHNGNKQVEGILLTDVTERRLYYPHVASDTTWWTGIVAYNPSSSAVNLMITPYDADGGALSLKMVTVGGQQKYVGFTNDLDFAEETAWFQIEASRPIAGFELFGTKDGKQLAGYSSMNGSPSQGVFAKIEQGGWTGIALVNAEDDAAVVELTAYADDGRPVAVKTLELAAHAKVVNFVEDIFAGCYFEDASYVAYSSAYNTVGFQLNGSTDGTMLDGLPGM